MATVDPATAASSTRTPATASPNLMAGVGFMLVFAAIAPLLDMFAKLAAPEATAAQTAFARFALQTAFLAPVLALRGRLRLPDRAEWAIHAARGAMLAAATTCFFTAIAVMPLADALAIVFVSPLILTLLAGPMLGESVGWRRRLACAAGLGGALLVAQPGFSEVGWVVTAPLGTAVFFALYLALTRRHGARSDPVTMQFWSGLVGALAMAATLALGFATGSETFATRPFGVETGLFLVGMGACATVAHLAIAAAFQRAPAGVLAPLQYLEIVTAVTVGWLVFGDLPGATTWAGVAVIVGAGLVVVHRERAAARRAHGPALGAPRDGGLTRR